MFLRIGGTLMPRLVGFIHRRHPRETTKRPPSTGRMEKKPAAASTLRLRACTIENRSQIVAADVERSNSKGHSRQGSTGVANHHLCFLNN